MQIEKGIRNYVQCNGLSYKFDCWLRILRDIFWGSTIHIDKQKINNRRNIIASIECPAETDYDFWSISKRSEYYSKLENMDDDVLDIFMIILLDRIIEEVE